MPKQPNHGKKRMNPNVISTNELRAFEHTFVHTNSQSPHDRQSRADPWSHTCVSTRLGTPAFALARLIIGHGCAVTWLGHVRVAEQREASLTKVMRVAGETIEAKVP